MTSENLDIPGAWVFTPRQFSDERGTFFEWYQDSVFEEETGKKMMLAQANCSISTKGTLRGLHYADVPPGQAKYVTCFAGRALDVLVDVRKGSPTFGKWRTVLLDTSKRNVVSIPNGVAHGFMALEENTTIVYLCDQRYNPANEYEINPLDPEIGIPWPDELVPNLSDKDRNAPNFRDLIDSFPIFDGI